MASSAKETPARRLARTKKALNKARHDYERAQKDAAKSITNDRQLKWYVEECLKRVTSKDGQRLNRAVARFSVKTSERKGWSDEGRFAPDLTFKHATDALPNELFKLGIAAGVSYRFERLPKKEWRDSDEFDTWRTGPQYRAVATIDMKW